MSFDDSPLNSIARKNHPAWTNREQMDICRRTIYACCLVCRSWYRIYMPYLYRYIVFFDHRTVTLFLRLIWHTNKGLRNLVRGVTVYMTVAKSSEPFNGWTAIPLYLPSLIYFYILGVDISRYPSSALSKIKRLLPVTCHTKITTRSAAYLPSRSVSRFLCNLKFDESYFIWEPVEQMIGGSRIAVPSPEGYIVRATLTVGRSIMDQIDKGSINASLRDMGDNLTELVLDLTDGFDSRLDLQYNSSLRVLVLCERPSRYLYDESSFADILPLPSRISTRELHIIFRVLSETYVDSKFWDYLFELIRSDQIPNLHISFNPGYIYDRNTSLQLLAKTGIQVPCPPFVKDLPRYNAITPREPRPLQGDPLYYHPNGLYDFNTYWRRIIEHKERESPYLTRTWEVEGDRISIKKKKSYGSLGRVQGMEQIPTQETLGYEHQTPRVVLSPSKSFETWWGA